MNCANFLLYSQVKQTILAKHCSSVTYNKNLTLAIGIIAIYLIKILIK